MNGLDGPPTRWVMLMYTVRRVRPRVELTELDAWSLQLVAINRWEEQRCRSYVMDRHGAEKVENFSFHLDFYQYTCKTISLPIFISSFVYGVDSYQVLISAVSGAVVGNIPFGFAPFSSILVRAARSINGVLGHYLNQENELQHVGNPEAYDVITSSLGTDSACGNGDGKWMGLDGDG
eukprot:TRINITY_DN12932_c0_g1_i18.p1 TRINITY_DN12932_c0_g1~~TRINITY_DN12932_c0_g1_i18.p1  ORF type:complete len:178 (-),score=34.36 TRINITY_DN12932_c0_g1_i18:406-939(-)